MDKYKKENTYLVLETATNAFLRWNNDKSLFFAGSAEDALIDLESDFFYAIPVSECSELIQKEYEQKIDNCIKNKEIE